MASSAIVVKWDLSKDQDSSAFFVTITYAVSANKEMSIFTPLLKSEVKNKPSRVRETHSSMTIRI